MPTTSGINLHTDIGALSHRVQQLLQRALLPLVVLLVVETVYLAFSGRQGAVAFGYIAGGSCVALGLWSRFASGLPLLPVFVIQHLITFGLPIVTHHDVLTQYSAANLVDAGFEVFIFCLTLALSWWISMNVMVAKPAVCHALKSFRQDASRRLKRIGWTLVLGSSAFQIAQCLSALDSFYNALPAGAYSLVLSIVATASTCGFFLVAMFVGSGSAGANLPVKMLFWGLLALSCFIGASGYLLSVPTTVIAAAALGLFWGTGRIPWRFLVIVIAALSFLNLGKFTMRERYWQEDEGRYRQVQLTELPHHYLEWAEASLAMLNGTERPEAFGRPGVPSSRQTLLERINNLQNLLFVIAAIETDHTSTLGGATYTLIPKLLVPRILWPEKPRAHEGQVMLNVHFGRQDLNSTFTAYVAWGLLAEAYGNFGPVVGALVLGLGLGIVCAWIETFSARKLLMSTEGFLCFTLLLTIVSSFEMVASVLVTTLFQTLILIAVASLPFVERVELPKPSLPE